MNAHAEKTIHNLINYIFGVNNGVFARLHKICVVKYKLHIIADKSINTHTSAVRECAAAE